MNITPPNDSTALAQLGTPTELRTALSRPIPKVEQTNRIRPINEEEKKQQERQQSRRQKERRQRQESVLLNTRANQERRSVLNQDEVISPKGQGIDVMA